MNRRKFIGLGLVTSVASLLHLPAVATTPMTAFEAAQVMRGLFGEERHLSVWAFPKGRQPYMVGWKRKAPVDKPWKFRYHRQLWHGNTWEEAIEHCKGSIIYPDVVEKYIEK